MDVRKVVFLGWRGNWTGSESCPEAGNSGVLIYSTFNLLKPSGFFTYYKV